MLGNMMAGASNRWRSYEFKITTDFTTNNLQWPVVKITWAK